MVTVEFKAGNWTWNTKQHLVSLRPATPGALVNIKMEDVATEHVHDIGVELRAAAEEAYKMLKRIMMSDRLFTMFRFWGF